MSFGMASVISMRLSTVVSLIYCLFISGMELANVKTLEENICENSFKELSCSPMSRIFVIDAHYGEAPKGLCDGTDDSSQPKCSVKAAKKIVKKLCNGKRSCTLAPNEDVFGKACNDVFKYLQVRYLCEKRAFSPMTSKCCLILKSRWWSQRFRVQNNCWMCGNGRKCNYNTRGCD